MMSLNNQFPTVEGEYERSPEEAALITRLRVFVIMRWLVIPGVIVVTLIASKVFNIGFNTLPVYIICAFMILYNLVLLWQVRSLEAERGGSVIHRARTYGNIHILLDLATLAVLLHFTGGIENPFIFYCVLHIVAASTILHYRVVYWLATSALVMVVMLVGLEYAQAIPHINLVGFADPTLYQKESYILSELLVLATLLYVSAFLATAISGELRKRQRQVVQLRESLLQKKTDELEMASKEIAKLEETRNRFLQFLGVTVHDLKAPLTAIQSYFWVMLGGFAGEITDKQRNMLERSSHRIKELLNLISDLLDIPRIETGQIVQEMKLFSLSQIIKASVGDLRDLGKQKNVKLKAELPQGLPKIYGSGPKLQQVITNLINNAINYTPEGTVTVRVNEEDNDIKIEVMDTGIGIPSEDLSHIFDDFFRASNVETKGTGLGLSITKRIVEAHGGRIWVESPCPETNTGSKFTFTLPKKSGN